jgi:hypothetical protein
VGSTIYTHGNRGIRLRWWSLDIEPGLKSEPLNVVTEVHSHPDGKPKRMLIDGEWLEADFLQDLRDARPGNGRDAGEGQWTG